MDEPEIVADVTVPGWLLWLLVGLGAAGLVALVLNFGRWAIGC